MALMPSSDSAGLDQPARAELGLCCLLIESVDTRIFSTNIECSDPTAHMRMLIWTIVGSKLHKDPFSMLHIMFSWSCTSCFHGEIRKI